MLPVFRRFSISDLPTAPDWINSLLGPLNIFCEQTVLTLNKNLAVGSNVQGMKYSTRFTALPTYDPSINKVDITFNYTGNGRPDCLMIGSILAVNGSSGARYPLNVPVFINNWELSTSSAPYQVKIYNISGLSAGTTYDITFVML